MLRGLGAPFRLLSIARTLARHDALAPLQELEIAPLPVAIARMLSRRRAEGRPGQKLARALTELGPAFIKLGQFLSTRSDLLGEQVAADLSDLQDRLAPFPAKVARDTVEDELGAPAEALFEHFEDEPVSAASIAQVHLAVTAEGEEVAVKVLRPGVEAAFKRDLDLLYGLAEVVETTQPALRRLQPVKAAQVFAEQTLFEMDLRMEAAAAAELAENFSGDPDYRLPPVDWQRSSRRVLTLGRLSGIPIDDRDALVAAGHDLEEVLRKAATIFFQQVFRDGLFHGDQHPGNMFVDEAGNIGAVDFGIMGRLDRKTRSYLADMMIAVLARDYRRLAEVHVDAGYLPPGKSLDTFGQALRAVCEPIFGRPLNEISFARLLGQLFRLSESFDLEVQPQLLLLQKNMVMAEGVSRRLMPELNIWTLAQPLIEQWMIENRGPEARLRDTAQDLVQIAERLPALVRNLDRAAEDLAEGGLRLHPESAKALAGSNRNAAWHLRALWAALAILLLLVLLD